MHIKFGTYGRRGEKEARKNTSSITGVDGWIETQFQRWVVLGAIKNTNWGWNQIQKHHYILQKSTFLSILKTWIQAKVARNAFTIGLGVQLKPVSGLIRQ